MNHGKVMQGKPKGSIQPIEKTSLSTANGIGPVVGEVSGFQLTKCRCGGDCWRSL